jgi:Flp pilus assembly protein TadG
MRRLMRRLAARIRRDERGAVSVIVAVSMVALLGFVAITVDIGALYAERAELQSGADAAALAVAQDCAASGTCTTTGPTASWLATATTTARSLANENARDGATNIASLASPAQNSVRITTGTRDGSSGAGALAFVFAPVLGIDSASPTATATAGWGSPAAGPAAIGLAFAPCEFALGGPIQVVSIHGGATCSSTSPSGQNLPGGFGWLAAPAGTCSTRVDIAVNAIVSSDTGTSLPSGCGGVLAANLNRTVLLPVYSDVGGGGSGGWYKIRGWAAFELLGWNFPGSSANNNSYTGAKCTGSCKGIIGRFVRFVSLDDRFTRGGPDLGASLVSLTQ